MLKFIKGQIQIKNMDFLIPSLMFFISTHAAFGPLLRMLFHYTWDVGFLHTLLFFSDTLSKLRMCSCVYVYMHV